MKLETKQSIYKDIKEWIIVLSSFIIINCFLFQPFKIPSGSMIPTLLVGDFLIANKYCYGYSNDSFRIWNFTIPLPKITHRLFAKDMPQAGDIIVFRNEKDRNVNYIKRIIGLPGDKIELKDGIVYVNDVALKVTAAGEFTDIEKGEYRIYRRYIETLPNGYEHVIVKIRNFGESDTDNCGPYYVPEGHYFCMGDNRDNSQDSRFPKEVGFIPLENIMGKAMCIFFSTKCSWYEIHKWLFSLRLDRFFTAIK